MWTETNDVVIITCPSLAHKCHCICAKPAWPQGPFRPLLGCVLQRWPIFQTDDIRRLWALLEPQPPVSRILVPLHWRQTEKGCQRTERRRGWVSFGQGNDPIPVPPRKRLLWGVLQTTLGTKTPQPKVGLWWLGKNDDLQAEKRVWMSGKEVFFTNGFLKKHNSLVGQGDGINFHLSLWCPATSDANVEMFILCIYFLPASKLYSQEVQKMSILLSGSW